MKLSEGNRINGHLLVERRYRGFNEQVNNLILFVCLFLLFCFSCRRCRKAIPVATSAYLENLPSHYTQNVHLNQVSNYV